MNGNMRIFAIGLLLVLSACQNQTPPAAEAFDQAAVEAEVAEVVDAIVLGAEMTDVDALEPHWLDEVSLVLYGTGPEAIDR